jgi:hypothetical protein
MSSIDFTYGMYVLYGAGFPGIAGSHVAAVKPFAVAADPFCGSLIRVYVASCFHALADAVFLYFFNLAEIIAE